MFLFRVFSCFTFLFSNTSLFFLSSHAFSLVSLTSKARMFILLGASNVVRMISRFGTFQDEFLSLAVSGASVSKLPKNPHLGTILKKFLSQTPRETYVDATLILMAGTNDFVQGVTREKFQKDLECLIRLCRRNFSKIVLGQIPPIPLLPGRLNDIIMINHWMHSLTSDRIDLKIADTFVPFMNRPPFQLRIKLQYFEERYPSGRRDGIHLNETGLFMLKCGLLETAAAF